MIFDFQERLHGHCAALPWLYGLALGSIGDHAVLGDFMPFKFSIERRYLSLISHQQGE